MARTRYTPTATPPPLTTLPGAALRAVLAEGYGKKQLRADVLSGLVVGVVALPLSMALAIAVGVQHRRGDGHRVHDGGQQGVLTLVTAVQPQPRSVLQKAGIAEEPGRLRFCTTLAEAVEAAKAHVGAAK